MGAELREQKRRFRRHIKNLISVRSEAELEIASTVMVRRLLALPEWRKAAVVLGFSPIRGEPDIKPALEAAIAEGRIVGLPRVTEEGLSFHRVFALNEAETESNLGIKEPDESLPKISIPPQSGDPMLVIVPGLAFDRSFSRLGRGGGYYDRFIRRLRETANGPSSVFFVAVCFDAQLVDEVPAAENDEPVDAVVTESVVRRSGPSLPD
jgi:5-formyltetrahydrofolate cyclo-ligase